MDQVARWPWAGVYWFTVQLKNGFNRNQLKNGFNRNQLKNDSSRKQLENGSG
jgi:hypothetical protein